jgi:chemotaxis protein histidine kinase CheA
MSSLEVTIMMNNMMSGMMRSVANQVIDGCASKYGFDASEAKELLNLKVINAAKKIVSEKPKKEAKMKASFPLPFNGEHSGSCCQALRQNNGLYTQCQGSRKGLYCKSCQQLADKSADGIPEYGTISMRLATNPYDYVDPKGRKPTSYTKIMKKYNLTQEQVLEEAGKFGITIDASHFVVPEETKRGRPAKAPKEPKEAKAVKGRPKKSNKVIALADDEEDLFASLVAQASASEESEIDKEAEKEAKKAEEKAAKEADKAAKAEKLAQEKAAKEAEKEAKKQALEAEKAAKAEKLAQEKEAKKQALEAEKAAKAEKLAQEKAAKEAAKVATKKAPKAKEPVVEEPSEEETYKKCTGQDGKKYIRSQQTNIVYDLDIYTAKEELVPVGKWIADSKTIVFNKADDSDSELEDDEVDE